LLLVTEDASIPVELYLFLALFAHHGMQYSKNLKVNRRQSCPFCFPYDFSDVLSQIAQ
jgi:hypothetical protein